MRFRNGNSTRRYAMLSIILVNLVCLSVNAVQFTIQYDQRKSHFLHCPFAPQGRDQCNPGTYRTTVFTWGIPGFIIAVVIFLFLVCYPICKYIFNCCGGRYQSPNFCCPSSSLPAKYSRAELLRPRLYIVLCTIITFITLIWGTVSVTKLNTAMKQIRSTNAGLVQTMSVSAEEFYRETTFQLYDHLSGVTKRYSPLSTTEGRVFQESVTAVQKQVNTMLDNLVFTVVDQLHSNIGGFYALLVLALAASLFGLGVALLNKRRYFSMIFLYIIGTLAIVCWVCQGLASSAFFSAEGLCTEVTAHAHHWQNVMTSITNCNETTFGTYGTSLAAVQQAEVTAICTLLASYCYDSSMSADANAAHSTVLACPSLDSCTNAPPATFEQWSKNYYYTSEKITSDSAALQVAKSNGLTCTTPTSCSLQTCANECKTSGKLSPLGQAAKEATSRFQGIHSLLSASTTIGSAYSTCQAFLEATLPPYLHSCALALPPLYSLEQCFGLLGVGLIGGIFAAVVGAKRFIPFHQMYRPQYDV